MKLTTLQIPLALVLLSLSLACRADVLDSWTTNQIATNSFGLMSVAYGSGRYVAAGEYSDYGCVYSSEDGFQWTLRATDPSAWGLKVSYGGGRFVGVSAWGIVVRSTNGLDWTFSQMPYPLINIGYFGAITYGNALFVAVGQTNGVGLIVTSPDAQTWTTSSSSPGPGGRIVSVVRGAGKFVALGDNDGFEYTSFTGTGTWIKSSIPGGRQINFLNGLYIVPLNNQTNLLSLDGVKWTAISTGLTNQLGRITRGNGLFMGCAGNYLATSTDGTNWIQYAKWLPSTNLATDGIRLVTVSGEYRSGGPNAYNGFVFTSDVLVGVRKTDPHSSGIALSGLVGRNYQIQSADALSAGSNNWQTNVTLQLPNPAYVWTDSTATNAQRFYRGVLLP